MKHMSIVVLCLGFICVAAGSFGVELDEVFETIENHEEYGGSEDIIRWKWVDGDTVIHTRTFEIVVEGEQIMYTMRRFRFVRAEQPDGRMITYLELEACKWAPKEQFKLKAFRLRK